MNKLIISVFLLLWSTVLQAQDFKSWATTPPMGWNSWDCFGPTVIEQEVRANADYMAKHLKEFGWQYVVVDIRWYVENDKAHGYNENNPIMTVDEYGRFIPAVNRFPSSSGGRGFKPLADYCHGLGLKFGIHIMRGIPRLAVEKNTPIPGTRQTARGIYSAANSSPWLRDMYTVDAGKPGAQEYYNSLFALYSSWGLDFVKVDDISSPYHKDEIELIRHAIDNCGRPIVLSLSPGPTPLEEAKHVSEHANMWRIIGDFWDNWTQLEEHFKLFEQWVSSMGPGHWPDGDMLPLGRIGIRAEQGDPRMSGFTRDEQVTLMTLFSICRSPMFFGGNLPDNDQFTMDLMTNREVLSVLQKSTNNRLLFDDPETIAWRADDPVSNDKYVALFYVNRKPILEDKALWSSKLLTCRTGEQSANVKVHIGNARKIYLVVTDGGNGTHWDHADWIEPTLSGEKGMLKLTDLHWVSATSGWSIPKVHESVMGNRLIVDNKQYADGIGTHATSIIEYDIPAGYDTFSSIVGLDAECVSHPEGATVKFHVFTDHPTGSSGIDSVKVPVRMEQLGLKGPCRVRDLWGKSDIGTTEDEITVYVRSHGARLLKISRIN
ncbi:MAG TPA: NPCBM/NEW2 domain-containing protein [Bacteroidota bacterium]|nr:NPCBM/NEW2 domain-containing protein [Bacteroidota bacterium]